MGDTKIWAHRGASGYAPENTLEAFELAVAQGADGVELDVQLTKDGELVVIHDETIDRTSNWRGNVIEYTLKELKNFNFNCSNPNYVYAEISTLKEVYELLKPTNLIINVELKTGIIFYEGIEEKVLKLSKDMDFEDRVIYSSFNHYTIKKIKELNNKARTGLLYCDGWIGILEYAKKLGVTALHPCSYNLQYENLIEECKKENIRLHVWTVNEGDEMNFLYKNKVDSIITNYPDVARGIRNNL